jgi:2-dehydro-3-deoxygalactonokinase
MRDTTIIGVDWGSTNVRAFLMDADGELLDRRDSARGGVRLDAGEYPQVLRALIAGWPRDPARPVLLCGMVGAREGWAEAPYARCPAQVSDLAAGLISIVTPDGEVRIVPGLAAEDADGLMDVMRGEETQVIGAIDHGYDGLVLAPGTHSKWISVTAGRMVGLKTFMTGELFALLSAQSVLAKSIEGDAPDPAAFRLGVSRALADASLSRLLFSVRTEALFGRLPVTSTASYLSGLLIGAEIQGGLALVGPKPPKVTVIGVPALAALYADALAVAGVEVSATVDGGAAAARGLWRFSTHLTRQGA